MEFFLTAGNLSFVIGVNHTIYTSKGRVTVKSVERKIKNENSAYVYGILKYKEYFFSFPSFVRSWCFSLYIILKTNESIGVQ